MDTFVDSCIIQKLLTETGAVKGIQDEGITSDMLFDEYKAAFAFILGHFRQYGVIPDVTTMNGAISGVVLGTAPEPLLFYTDQIKRRYRLNKTGEAVKQAVALLESKSPEEALRVVIETAQKLKATTSGASLVDLTTLESQKERAEQYIKAKAMAGKVDGIPTPWDTINKATRGIHNGELWVFLGKLKIGKTHGGIAMAVTAWKAGKKVLVVSEEMSISRITQRIDAHNSKLPYKDFMDGTLATAVETAWAASMADMQGKPNFWVANRQRVKNVADLEILMEELQPDFVFVDGAYFLEAGGASAKKWERTSTVVDQLQALVQRKNKPILISWQFTRQVSTGKTEGFAEEVAFAYEVVQNADMVLGLFRDEQMVRQNRAVLRVVEARECEKPNPLLLEWDFQTMNFGEIGPYLEGMDGGGGGSGGGSGASAATEEIDYGA